MSFHSHRHNITLHPFTTPSGAHRAVANVIVRLAPFGTNGDLITETSDVKVRSPKYAAAFATGELTSLPVPDSLDVAGGDKLDHSTDDILDSASTVPGDVGITIPEDAETTHEDVETTPHNDVETTTHKDVETTTHKDVETTPSSKLELTDALDSIPPGHTEAGIKDPTAAPAGAIMMSLTVASIACIGVFAYFFYRKKGGFSGGRGRFTAVPMNELDNGRV